MTKFNIQFSVDNTIEYTKSFKIHKDVNDVEIKELYMLLLKRLNEKMIEQQFVKPMQTIIRPTNVKIKIDKNTYKISRFRDALKRVFEYIVDNNYVEKHTTLYITKNEILYSNKNFDLRYKRYCYKGYYLNQYFTRTRMLKVINLLIDTFELQKNIKIKNWPK